MMNSRLPVENADTVSLVCALLVRFPELTSLRALPNEKTVRLTFAVRQRLDKRAQAACADSIAQHIDGYQLLAREEAQFVRVECEADRSTSFVHIVRDTESFSKEELEMLVALLRDRFGDALACSPVAEDADSDPVAQDEAAVYAIEALRDPQQSKSLVGFREEARVLVYFLKTQRKAKAASRR